MRNPIKELRLERGMTQKELAELAGMTPHGLLRYEQGLYENLSNNLLTTISDHFGFTPEDHSLFIQQYDAFRLEIQRNASIYMDNPPPVQISPNHHPFETFRDHVTLRAVGTKSRIRFCILLAVNPAVVLNYDKGKQGPMPSLISEALKTANLDERYLEMLNIYGQLWHERYGC